MNYGTVTLAKGYWEVRCDPQVRTLLKRVFPKAPQQASDAIRLSDNAQNGRDLLWFLQRYPMEVRDMPHLLAQSHRHIECELSIAALLGKVREPETFELAKPARDYQAFAATMVEVRGALLLADELGLGKTVSGMCPLVRPGRLPAVVVYPAYLPNHWEEKIAEFLPELRVHTIKASKPYDLIKRPGSRVRDLWDTLPDVIVISYHKLRGWAETLAEIARYAVFEECQQLRNNKSELYHAAEYFAQRVPLKMGLSATPIYNYGEEFYWVINVLMPGVLGTFDEFVREWCATIGNGKHRLKDPDAFGEFLRREGVMLRRTRKDVGRELPQCSVIPHQVNADTLELNNGGADAIALARTIVAHNEQYRGERFHASGEFDRMLRQATGIAKAPYVADFVRMLVESGERVVLFGWHRAVYDIWLERLADLKPVMYTGSESPRQKRLAKEAFVSGESKVLIMSLRSGAGMDGIQYVCKTAVIGEIDWSSGVMKQCIGRIDRDGQEEPTFGYVLLSDQGADPVMARVAGIKYEQLEGVINPDAPLTERVDIGENSLRELARHFLEQSGIEADESELEAAA
ncbi:MAG: SNF2-related protein [Rhodanobacter sp.]